MDIESVDSGALVVGWKSGRAWAAMGGSPLSGSGAWSFQ